jgi:predicted nuclease of predicted toxin-antitoxin system
MQFKVDENLHDDVAEALRAGGHGAVTVHDQRLRGSADDQLGEVCRAEGRALLTLDLDFANIRDYPPQDYPGLIVMRLADQSRPHVLSVLPGVLDLLNREPLTGSLWIVEEHRVRIRRAEKETP